MFAAPDHALGGRADQQRAERPLAVAPQHDELVATVAGATEDLHEGNPLDQTREHVDASVGSTRHVTDRLGRRGADDGALGAPDAWRRRAT